jgi:uncharacterized membrane protein YkoI
MFRFPILPATILPAAMAAMIAVGATGAVHASTGESESRREVATVLGAKTSLVQAIDAAERHSGGRAMKIDVEKKNGAFLYEVKTVAKDRITEVLVDPASGTVVGTDDEGLIARILDREDQDELARLAGSPTTLAAAIATAEKETGGTAIEAKADGDDGAMRYKVEVAKDNAVRKVTIDGATGKVVKVAAYRHDDDDEKDDD